MTDGKASMDIRHIGGNTYILEVGMDLEQMKELSYDIWLLARGHPSPSTVTEDLSDYLSGIVPLIQRERDGRDSISDS